MTSSKTTVQRLRNKNFEKVFSYIIESFFSYDVDKCIMTVITIILNIINNNFKNTNMCISLYL